ncbi:oxidase EvaA [Hamadaea flava]|uniref:NDP-hexose 2,3-dehydratase family protein n=1 Tax=Hamadaea flava TaxID=1742688 RepID=A0ABV8LMY9_9ACTN|nr:NDP-hexose 2,3-dehydratase family protein [Hamadaea flava]MCP2329566.1 oxidase EvaA [Hamadaea flava]
MTRAMFDDLAEFYAWFAEQHDREAYRTEQIPVEDAAAWRAETGTGNIVHDSGKFFSIQGLHVETDHRDTPAWRQPIIVQDEIGILGLLVKVVDRTVYCLMQAKMEPGNINVVQLSPTVQATRSNYTRVHGGATVPYLDHFVAPRSGRTVFDALQSEQGSWFYQKRNRNIIIEIDGEVPLRDSFCWLSVDLVIELLKVPNLVNMDSRTVLSGLPYALPGPISLRSRFAGPAVHRFQHILSWLCEAKTRYRLYQELIPLAEVPHWHWSDGRLVHGEGRFFSVMAVDVTAASREVTAWSQPMLAPIDRGLVGFLGRSIDGVFHVLAHARTEAGTRDIVEIGPSVACNPANYARGSHSRRPVFLDVLLGDGDVLVDVVHSEEGGRFYHAENRYLVVDVGEDFDLDVPDDYCWLTIEQLSRFVRFGNLVNVYARCLISCMVGLSEPAPRDRSKSFGAR